MKTIIYTSLICFGLISNAGQSFAQTSSLGKNIISVSPIQVIAMDHLDNNNAGDFGINIAYERISNNEYFGFKLPVTFSLQDPYYYFMPALKIYPFRQGPVKFAFGPQFYIGTGEVEYNYSYYEYPLTIDKKVVKEKTQVGFLINTSVNFSILKNLFMGVDAGIGLNYFDNSLDGKDAYIDDPYYYRRNDSQFYPALQLNFSMGYRF